MPNLKQNLARYAEFVSTVWTAVVQLGLCLAASLSAERTLPPKTSSPMIMHPAVCIMRLLFSSADVTDVMMPPSNEREVGAEVWA